ncbi:hypothetical protein SLEP1_g57131 [Rubroshorea leprosula]|uniref:Disease resistance protein At4g27190-like leucine-rich repeats domain-containing protein n=1 Tax=Rubroshorea leprosula TaxID=152421 RepID=A0AAV5MLX2_9ROSI|nr:hypothetical protein SLEP1_g57131 [Rubroshorea leprosula]
MHDLVRDFATSTVSKEYGVLALTEDAPINWSHMEAMESIKWIYLSNGNTSQLPDELKCPKLTFFHLSEKTPSLASPPNLFRDKEGLKVLSLSKMNFLSIPSLISPPKNLRTLCLDQVELGAANIGTMMGALENLQVLSLAGSDIKELPKQIGQLTKLKLLDLSDCNELKVIPPGVLSNLSGLEELYMRNSFVQWAEGIEEHENQNASLAELQTLMSLTSIELHVLCKIWKIPEGLFSENLARFKVFLGDRWNNWNSSWGVSKLLKLKPDARSSSHHSVRKLLKKTNELHLEGLIGIKNVVNELDNDGFQELKYLFVQDALEIQHIIPVKPAFPVLEVLVLRNLENMEKICHGPLEAASFRKLRLITIECCNKLKNLFSASIARQLQQLQEIRVKHCTDMEEIIDDKEQESGNSAEEREGHIVELITLRSLKLQRLPKLISFNSSCRNMTFFNEKVVLTNLEELQLFSIMVDNTLWHNSMTSYIEKLTKLIIHGCTNYVCTMPSLFMEKVVSASNLEELQLCSIERTTTIWEISMISCFEKLKKLIIDDCKNLEYLFSSSVESDSEGMIQLLLPKLKRLELGDLPQLKSICRERAAMVCDSLERIIIWNCHSLRRFPLYFPQLENGQPSPPPSLKQIVVWPQHYWKSLEWDHPYAGHVLLQFCGRYDSFPFKLVEGRIKRLELTDIDVENTWVPPSVQELVLNGCNYLRSLNDISSTKDAEGLKCCRIRDCNGVKCVLSSSINLLAQKLEALDLFSLENLEALFEAEAITKSPLPLDTFSSLKTISVWQCHKIKTLFPFWMNLQSLEEIEIGYCNQMEEIIVWDAEEAEAITKSPLPPDTFSSLKTVSVGNCHKIKKLFPFWMNLQSLEEIRIEYCDQMEEIIVWDVEEAEAITKSPLPPDTFSSLKTISVCHCHKIKTLFPFWMNLQSLEEIHIGYCNQMEEIIVWDAEEAGGEKEGVIQLILPKLKILKLKELPALKSICSRRAVMVCDSLKEIWIWNCQGLRRIPLYLSLLDNGQPSPPPSLERIKIHSVVEPLSLINEEDEEEITYCHSATVIFTMAPLIDVEKEAEISASISSWASRNLDTSQKKGSAILNL